jgi:hypothetical protein
MQFVKGTVIDSKAAGDYSLVCLKRNDGSLFVVRDYRITALDQGSYVTIEDCEQIEDYVSEKSGKSLKQYSNQEVPDTTGRTEELDNVSKKGENLNTIEMTAERALIIAGFEKLYEELKGEAAPYFYASVVERAHEILY